MKVKTYQLNIVCVTSVHLCVWALEPNSLKESGLWFALEWLMLTGQCGGVEACWGLYRRLTEIEHMQQLIVC